MKRYKISEKEKLDYLDEFKRAVDKYTPLIERRTGINMGNVEVKDYSCYTKPFVGDQIKYLLDVIGKREDNYFERMTKKAILLLLSPILNFGEENENKMALYIDFPVIYIPFGDYAKRYICDKSIRQNQKQAVEQITVHELTHRLWTRIKGSTKLSYTKLEWKEGFAAYGERHWFADFYQSKIFERYSYSPDSAEDFYDKCSKVIKDLVSFFGEEILFSIPRDWEQIENFMYSFNKSHKNKSRDFLDFS